MAHEKDLLGGVSAPRASIGTRATSRLRVVAALLLLVPTIALLHRHGLLTSLSDLLWLETPAEDACRQVAPLWPQRTTDQLTELDAFYDSEAFRNLSIAHLVGAVQVRSESFDDLGPVGKDDRWDVFFDFAAYLETTYPLVHRTFVRERVNTHGLVFTWNGSEPSLQPTLLLAHQDTVPVPAATLDQWTYPPWSGHFDGAYVWGRGAADCKSQLTAILDALEQLIARGFQPRRTLLVAFGFDEEASGPQGAGHLGPFLLARYGPESVAVLVDEGSALEKKWGTVFALPGVAEKGYIDLEITVRTDGGHSSVPPPHTGIGILSEIVTVLEAHVFRPYIHDQNPYLGQLQCGAAHAASFPHRLRKLLRHRRAHAAKPGHDALAEEAAKQGRGTRYLIQTSVAVDIITGGAKINALPEEAAVRINHRVNIGERPADVVAHVLALLRPLARKHGLDLATQPYNATEDKPLHAITVAPLKGELEPAPVTPTRVGTGDGDSLTPYALLAGTTRALYGEDVVVAPGLTTGNTDTRYYWGLTPHIFRFGVGFDEDAINRGVHTVNERQSIFGHIRGTKWISNFIRNVDEADLP